LLFAVSQPITSKQARQQVTARLSWDPAADIFHAAVNEQTWPPQGLKITGGQLMQRRTFFKGLGGGLLAAFAGPDIAWGQSRGQSPASTPATAAVSAFPVRTERRGALLVTLGPVRVVMRGPMFPVLARLGGDTIVLSAQAVEEGGPLAAIRSDDLGNTWRATGTVLDGMGLNTLQLRSGKAISHHYDTKPIPGKPGWRRTRRWESSDNWKTVQGPLEDGILRLPPDQFNEDRPQWFHGNTLELPNGDLLAAMQDFYSPERFRTFVSKSTDHGKTWDFLAHVASLDNLRDPQGATKKGWTLWGPCEPNMVHLGDGRLVCVMRLVNDDSNPLLAKPADSYHDLSCTVSGDGIHPGTLPASAYYTIGEPSAPLVIAFSSDYGATWTPPEPMAQARGCFPRMALSEGVIALTYGALAYPRWGNCVTFSTDGGKSWSDEVNFAPFLTTGYTDILAIGARKFLCVFDCAPPQPWKNHAAHWVGALDVTVAT